MAIKKRKFSKFLKFFTLLSLFIFLTLIISFSIINKNLQYVIPDILSVELYDKNGFEYLSYSNNKKQSYVKLDSISPKLIEAFISIEDKKFYEHSGIDIRRIVGALGENIKSGETREGASTITQQYVKTVFLNNEKTLKRKLYEAMISINFESKYTKEEILEGYLNAIYFDHGIYGVEDASMFYFNKSAADLTLLEAVSLASIPNSPSRFSPIKNPDNNITRRNLILSEMYEDGKIDTLTYNNTLNEHLEVYGVKIQNTAIYAPYFQDMVMEELSMMPIVKDYAYSGLKVYTTLDRELTNEITKSLDKRITSDELEASVIVQNPNNGNIEAIIGGKDYSKSTYNRAFNAVRQSGSTIKPFLYYAALENGFTPATTFKSEPSTFYYDGTSYTPHNFGNIYAYDNISMVYALATSDNMYAVKTHLYLGTDVLKNTLKKFGFSGDIPSIPSLCLGVKEFSLKELTNGYTVLASLGKLYKPILITKITDFEDNIIYERKSASYEKVADSSTAYILNESMTSIFDNRITYNLRPTGASIASMLNAKFAGKSGSTDTDSLFVGYNKDVTISVWCGYDDNRPLVLVDDLKASKYIFADVANYYGRTHNLGWYETPSDVIGVNLNPMTGFYPSLEQYSKPIYFKKDNIPWYVELLF